MFRVEVLIDMGGYQKVQRVTDKFNTREEANGWIRDNNVRGKVVEVR